MRGKTWAFLGGVGIGAAVMFFLDPSTGERRRAVARDRITRTSRRAGRVVEGKARDLGNRVRGVAARARARLQGDTPADDVLAQRVRTSLGRVISHPRMISIAARAGVVTLTGTVSEEEAVGLTACVRQVQGVREVVDETVVREAVAR